MAWPRPSTPTGGRARSGGGGRWGQCEAGPGGARVGHDGRCGIRLVFRPGRGCRCSDPVLVRVVLVPPLPSGCGNNGAAAASTRSTMTPPFNLPSIYSDAVRIRIKPVVFPSQRPSSPWIHAAVVEPHPQLINQSPRGRAQTCSIL